MRDELQTLERAVQGLRLELASLEGPAPAAVPSVESAWIAAKLEHLDDLLRTDPIRAKAEVGKHLEGDLVITPLPSEPGERRAQITGRVKSHSLLGETRRLRAFSWLRGLDLNQRPLGYELASRVITHRDFKSAGLQIAATRGTRRNPGATS